MTQYDPKTLIKDLSLDKNSLVIFDIDSTIYNVSPRTQKIVSEFCQLDSSRAIDPEACDILEKINIKSIDWGFAEALVRENFKSYFLLIQELTTFWRKHFFSNDYLINDQIYPGAKEYIQNLSKIVSIKYLTGRSAHTMHKGTFKQLSDDHLPLRKIDDLILKKVNEPDHIYKLAEVQNLTKSFDKIVIFENEPKIINHLYESIGNMPIVFINSTHSRKAKLCADFPVIEMDYRPFL